MMLPGSELHHAPRDASFAGAWPADHALSPTALTSKGQPQLPDSLRKGWMAPGPLIPGAPWGVTQREREREKSGGKSRRSECHPLPSSACWAGGDGECSTCWQPADFFPKVTPGGAILGTVLVGKNVKITLIGAINTIWAEKEEQHATAARAVGLEGHALRNQETGLEKSSRGRNIGSAGWRMHRIQKSKG